MTEKQKRFVEEYLIDLNATQAAIRAGYKPQNAAVIGCENLIKPNIQNAISKKMAERSRRTGVTADRVIMELARIAFVNADDVIDTETATLKQDVTCDDTAAIQSIKVKYFGENGLEREIKLADKLKALELLGKHLGLFRDKLEVDGNLKTDMTSLEGILQQINGNEQAVTVT